MASVSNTITPQQKAARMVAVLTTLADGNALIDFLDKEMLGPGSYMIVIDPEVLDESLFLTNEVTSTERPLSPYALRRQEKKLRRQLKQRARTRREARPRSESHRRRSRTSTSPR